VNTKKVALQSVSLQVHFRSDPRGQKPTLLFLHGFTGSGEDWYPLIDKIDDDVTPLVVDLIGHGMSDAPERPDTYTIPAQVDQLRELLDHFEIASVIPVGYSMGGRIALNFVHTCPELVSGAILEGTTPGIESEEQRLKRVDHDEHIATMIREQGVEYFIDYWMKIPLFDTQNNLPKDLLDEVRERKLRNSVSGLVNSLQAAGTGTMVPLWEALPKITVPVLLLTGAMDEKFTRINSRMCSALPNASHVVVKHAGHAVHLEKPAEFISAVNGFLKKQIIDK
jgi:2-succinyl-6-hydroxy-2,4-cyclohexadiene-1-carboxylate synthase